MTVLKELGSVAWAVVGVIIFDFDFAPNVSIDALPWLPEGSDLFELLVAVGAFALAIARYLSTRFRVTETSIEFRRGVVFRTERTTRRDRIQNVAVGTGLLGRIFGVRTVEISAGDPTDITLAFVGRTTAEALRADLLPTDSTPEVEETDKIPDSAGPARGVVIAELGRGGFVRYLVTGPLIGAVTIVILVVVLLVFADQRWPLFSFAGVIYLLMRSGDVYDFRAEQRGDRLHVTQGFIRREEKGAALDRVQMAQVVRPVIRGLFGHETVRIQTADVLGEQAQTMKVNLLSPLEARGEGTERVVGALWPIDITEEDLLGPAPVSLRRGILRTLIILVAGGLVVGTAIVVIASLVGWTRDWALIFSLFAGYLVVALLLAVFYGRRRYRLLGHVVGPDHIMVSTGVFRHRLAVVPIAKIQSVQIRRSFFQRRSGISDVAIDTAGMSLAGITATTVFDAPAQLGVELAGRLIDGASQVALPDGV
ncbi:MAG: PH domain-containing protein [Acidimicrobiia bacterium]|nr:PH domain-containing protein [Acidimicrobiia bacterium]